MIIKKIKEDILSSGLYKYSLLSIILKVGSSILVLALNIFLARELKIEQYGVYVFYLSSINILCLFTTFGFDKLLVREIAAIKEKNNWPVLRGLLIISYRTTFFILIIVLVIFLGLYLGDYLKIDLFLFFILFGLLSVFSYTMLRQSILRGLFYYIQGQLPEAIFRPVIMIAFLFIVHFFHTKALLARTALGLLLVASFFSYNYGFWLLKKYMIVGVKKIKPRYQTNEWLKSASLFFVQNVSFYLSTRISIIILGFFNLNIGISLFNASLQLSLLIVFVANAINMYLGPAIASQNKSNNYLFIRKNLIQASKISFGFGFIVFLIINIFSYKLLSLYGNNFIIGKTILLFLSIGYLINASIGLTGMLLNMTGHEKVTTTGVFLAGIINLILNLLLIPVWGVAGAAFDTMLSMIIWNVYIAIYAQLKFSIV